MQNKRKLAVVCVMLAALILAGMPFIGGCAGEEAALPEIISIQTTPVGSMFNVIGTGLAKVISDHTPIKGVVLPMSGFGAALPLFNSAELDMGLGIASNSEDGYYGIKTHAGTGGYDISIVHVGSPFFYTMIVRDDSGIETMADLKGRRVCWEFSGSPVVQEETLADLASAGLGEDDVIPVPVTDLVTAVRLVGDGTADATSVAIGAGVVTEVHSRTPLRWLSVESDPAAIERIHQVLPPVYTVVMPAGSHPLIKEDTTFIAEDIYLVARGTLSDAAVYEIAKVLWENYEELAPIHPIFRSWTPEGMVSNKASIPFHPGAIKFFKGVGAWTEEMEKLQKELLGKK